ncbi:MAG: hypothetical protein KJ645_08285 [Planctomycetes bacterium]|nr:hypothetical protein [Planctomycetota bacterium]
MPPISKNLLHFFLSSIPGALLILLFPAMVGCGGGSGGGGSSSAPITPAGDEYVVLAANDLGMHCMDLEFSVFSILPPFNVVHAQVVKRSTTALPTLMNAKLITVQYDAARDPGGSINSTSIGKTDFWDHAQDLFGMSLAPGQGLLSAYMPADAPAPGPQPMSYNAAHAWFSAVGIPLTPEDDDGFTNPYPLFRIDALSKTTGATLASVDAVVPVAQEMDCRNCHATGSIAASESGVTWSNHKDIEIQTKRNILILHDLDEGTSLLASQPVLCFKCHYSAALDLSGGGPVGDQIGKPVLSAAMHAFHGGLTGPGSVPLFPSGGTAEQTCYQCHPGLITQCLRDPMKAAGISCHECHGDMSAVGGVYPLLAGGSLDGTNDFKSRRPWMDLPGCQSCHTGDAVNHLSGAGLVPAPDGIRLSQAYRTNDDSASPIKALNQRFAENANTLFRFSQGHGGLACESCHGSTHAVWPNPDLGSNDNLAAEKIQGHYGAIAECSVCHAAGTLPSGTLEGPHGLHNTDQRWIGAHGDLYEKNKESCRACHGLYLLGTVLSRTTVVRSFLVEEEHGGGGSVKIPAHTPVRCNLCHEMPH